MRSEFIKNNITQVILLIFISVFSIWVAKLPLLNSLHYEFSAIVGIQICLITGIFFLANNSKIDQARSFYMIDLRSLVFIILIFFIPLLVSVYSTMYIVNCPVSEGIIFYIIFVLPSLVFGIMLANLSILIWNKLKYVVFILLFLVFLFLPIAEIYMYPQIYFFNPIIGYFPGTMFDEDIALDYTIISYRILVFFFSAVFSIIFYKTQKQKSVKKIVVIFFSILTFFILFFLKPYFDYSINLNVIEEKLGGKLETNNFRLIYSADIDSTEIRNLAYHHEFYLSKISEELADSLEQKINSFIFRDGAQKRKLFGANRADVAKPWLLQIYTDREHHDASLKHELVHVFSSKYGVTPFKVAYNFNPAMLEGFAMAIENNFDNKDVHTAAKLAFDNQKKVEISDLFSNFNFFSLNTSLAYVYAGSFMKYLLDNYGPESFKLIYGNLDFDKVYGKSIQDLESEYYDFLSSVPFTGSKDEANIYFTRKPIFKKSCVRYSANKLKSAWSIYNTKEYEKSEAMFEENYFYSGAYSALTGWVYSLKKQKKYSEAKAVIERDIGLFDSTSYLYNLEYHLADIYMEMFELEKADSLFKVMVKQNPTRDFTNHVKTRLMILEQADTLIKQYISSDNKARSAIIQNLYKKSGNDFLITPLISIFKLEKGNYKDFINNFRNQKLSTLKISSYSAFNLAKIAKDNLDYDNAIYFAEFAKRKSKDDNFKKISERLSDKIIWLKNNHEQIKIN